LGEFDVLKQAFFGFMMARKQGGLYLSALFWIGKCPGESRYMGGFEHKDSSESGDCEMQSSYPLYWTVLL
jgi:hypothetical protein